MGNRDMDALDAALGAIVDLGWEDKSAPQRVPEAITPEPIAEYPPAPVRPTRAALAAPTPVPAPRPTPAPEESGEAVGGVLDIGMLTDLAAGRTTAQQAADRAGVSVAQLQSSLATALREVPPEEITKALGLQAAEQQLKSGALYGAVLADLVADMAAGRLKAETKIELAKLLARVGRIEPKEDKGAGVGNGFVLNISLGAGREPVTIEAEQ